MLFGGKSLRSWTAVQKIDSIRIDQNTTSETKGRLFKVGKVTKRLFNIDPCTHDLAINSYR